MGIFSAIFGFLKLIPWQIYAGVAVIVALGAAHLSLVHKAVKANDGEWEAKIAAEQAAYAKQIAALKAKQSVIVEKEVVKYRDRVKIIKEKGDAIIKEIPVLVTGECVLSGGVRIIHDAAAVGHLPDDPAGAARAAAGVDAITLTETVAANYAACLQNAVRLASLQQLVKDLSK